MDILFSIFVTLGAVAGVARHGLLVIGAICVAQLDSDRGRRERVDHARTGTHSADRQHRRRGARSRPRPASRSDQVIGLLRTAVAEHHMVVLRNQHLSADEQAAVALAFGQIVPSPVQMVRGERGDRVDHRGHGIASARRLSVAHRPELDGSATGLRLPVGRDDPGVRGRHDLGVDRARRTTPSHGSRSCASGRRCSTPGPVPARLGGTPPRHEGGPTTPARSSGSQTPARCEAPRTGRRSLYLSPLYARGIVGPLVDDGRLLNGLNSMLDDPHVQVRWRWSEEIS